MKEVKTLLEAPREEMDPMKLSFAHLILLQEAGEGKRDSIWTILYYKVNKYILKVMPYSPRSLLGDTNRVVIC
ncbi:unnamed protein product [Urochloa humidicola]